MYRAKQKESEEMIRKLEKKGERLKRKNAVLTGRMFIRVSLNTQSKKPKKMQFHKRLV